MKAIVTGAAGFAGQHLVRHLRQCGDDVLEISRADWDLRHDPSADAASAIAAFAPDALFHLAALSIPAQCGEGEPTADAVNVNVEGTRRVAELASTISSRPRVVFVSTGRVYGDVGNEVELVNESQPTAPASSYAKTKLQAEAVLQSMGVDFIIARAFNHLGPGQLPPLMLPQWCQQIAEGTDALRVHNSNVWVDATDVRDVVRAYRLLALKGNSGEVYNVGSGTATRTGDIAKMLIDAASPGLPIIAETEAEHRNAISNTVRLRNLTDWQPEIPLRQTIADAWHCWLTNHG